MCSCSCSPPLLLLLLCVWWWQMGGGHQSGTESSLCTLMPPGTTGLPGPAPLPLSGGGKGWKYGHGSYTHFYSASALCTCGENTLQLVHFTTEQNLPTLHTYRGGTYLRHTYIHRVMIEQSSVHSFPLHTYGGRRQAEIHGPKKGKPSENEISNEDVFDVNGFYVECILCNVMDI